MGDGSGLNQANQAQANQAQANQTQANLYQANQTQANLYQANPIQASLPAVCSSSAHASWPNFSRHLP